MRYISRNHRRTPHRLFRKSAEGEVSLPVAVYRLFSGHPFEAFAGMHWLMQKMRPNESPEQIRARILDEAPSLLWFAGQDRGLFFKSLLVYAALDPKEFSAVPAWQWLRRVTPSEDTRPFDVEKLKADESRLDTTRYAPLWQVLRGLPKEDRVRILYEFMRVRHPDLTPEKFMSAVPSALAQSRSNISPEEFAVDPSVLSKPIAGSPAAVHDVGELPEFAWLPAGFRGRRDPVQDLESSEPLYLLLKGGPHLGVADRAQRLLWLASRLYPEEDPRLAAGLIARSLFRDLQAQEEYEAAHTIWQAWSRAMKLPVAAAATLRPVTPAEAVPQNRELFPEHQFNDRRTLARLGKLVGLSDAETVRMLTEYVQEVYKTPLPEVFVQAAFDQAAKLDAADISPNRTPRHERVRNVLAFTGTPEANRAIDFMRRRQEVARLYAEELEQLQALRDRGGLDAKTYDQAVRELRDRMSVLSGETPSYAKPDVQPPLIVSPTFGNKKLGPAPSVSFPEVPLDAWREIYEKSQMNAQSSPAPPPAGMGSSSSFGSGK